MCSKSSMGTFTQILWLLHGLFISSIYKGFMRCDLHVHSTGSGMCNTPGLQRLCRESYNQPAAVYERCKQRGMSLVTLTDHDSISGAEELRHHDDFFLSEEVTCRMPSGTEMHLGVYDFTERDHVEVQRRRTDFLSLVMYLTERKLFFSVNHVFSGLTGRRSENDFEWFASYAPAFEVRNGQMCPAANHEAGKLAERLGKTAVAGSDAHTLAGVGRTCTEVRGAQSPAEFFAGLRAGVGTVHGIHGSYARLTRDVFQITRGLFAEKSWTLALAPLLTLVPAVTAAHWLNEMRFCRFWSRKAGSGTPNTRLLWELEADWSANWAG